MVFGALADAFNVPGWIDGGGDIGGGGYYAGEGTFVGTGGERYRHSARRKTMGHRLHKKFEDTIRIDGTHAACLINQAFGGDERLFHLVGGAVLKAILSRTGIIVDTHDQPINRGMNPRGGPTGIDLYFRHKSNVDGTVEGIPGPNAGEIRTIPLRFNGSAVTFVFSDPYRPFDNIAMDLGNHLLTQARDNSRVLHHVRTITHSDNGADYSVIDIKDVAQSYISVYVGRVLKMRNVTKNDEAAGNASGFELDRVDANPIEGERVSFSGPAPRWRADVFSAFTNADAVDEGRLGAIADERVANGINVPNNIQAFVNPQATDNVAETGSGGGLLHKPRYKDLFTNVTRVKHVTLGPGQTKYMPTKFYYTGSLEKFLASFLSHYFPIGIGYCDMLMWRQSFPGHATHGEGAEGQHDMVTVEYVANTKMSAICKLTGPKRLPSQTVQNHMAAVAQ